MKSELLLLTLLWALTLNGFAIAVNARGPVRVTLSFAFAILCLGASVFHTSQYIVQNISRQAAVLEAPVPEVAPVVAEPEVDTAGLAASRQALALGRTRNQLKPYVETAKRLAERMAAVDLRRVADMTDAEYDGLQSKAFSFRSEVAKLKEKAIEQGPDFPPSLLMTLNRIQSAVDDLSLGVQAYDRFFKAENDDEEYAKLQSFQQSTRSALKSLNQAESELSTP